ncbi:MAG: peptide chain release factor N(5)-glutamine methyltransferase [Paludibacteraceae bacterium]|nr:peptide chain release factor N(5)-glutamine methyltransferase [Paludibacteraceae bacterium]MBR5823517.1 peptide chain release factor N(5)-glutamine methyltransferase [Paludibacteraceae bacterium]
MGYAFFIDMGQVVTPYIKRLLMSHITGLSMTQLLAERDLSLTEEQQKWYDEAIVRLKNNEPIQHILGYSEFYGRKLKCDRRALVPRPETEELVDWIISDWSTVNSQQSTVNCIDIGTGTGCIALSLAKELPLAKVTALDISIDALSLAHENAEMLEVGNVDFAEGDILNIDEEHCVAREKYAVIVSNPPYVRECEKAEMEANVLEYDPHTALFVSNEDPLIFYRTIGEFGLSHLEKDGALYFEINQYLSQETCDLLVAMGYKNVELREDINGNARMIKATL